MAQELDVAGFASEPAVPFEGIGDAELRAAAGPRLIILDSLKDIKWSVLPSAQAILQLKVAPGTVMIVHPGTTENMEAWLDWSLTSSDWVGMIVVSSDPQGLSSTKTAWLERFGKDKELGIHLFMASVYSRRADSYPAVRANAFVRFGDFLSKTRSESPERTRASVAKTMARLTSDQAIEADRQLAGFMLSTVTFVCAKLDEPRAAKRIANILGAGWTTEECDVARLSDSFARVEAIFHTRGTDGPQLPFMAERVRINHTWLRNSFLNNVQAAKKRADANGHATAADRDMLSREFSRIRDDIKAFLNDAPAGMSRDLSARAIYAFRAIDRQIQRNVADATMARNGIDVSSVAKLAEYPELDKLRAQVSDALAAHSAAIADPVATQVRKAIEATEAIDVELGKSLVDLPALEAAVLDLTDLLKDMHPGTS